ncbi:membrane protein insertase YidC [Corynebacterium ulcerans]|uniref:Membrane protein insertase YidC n=2 Tax=Corynebacterium ulcerans TaxID=65058 RepID=A0ABD0BJY6_CORUL|nr:membrane protein insertase YidC [Corynebacterium ulcerans]GJJ39269.1 membrane protein insertase YidC [Corynebacterium ulcerans]GJJ41806.1 membrane protein insertase YidC [Corynebacterium ulcerans]GJJ43229.1 membrane protein insertase YidC [Corynebacterium ulcerans]
MRTQVGMETVPLVIEIFIYPVSGVMKLWHLFLANMLGMPASLAWALSLFALVITVRGIVAPFTWMQLKSGRASILMRPKLKRLQEEYEEKTDKESILEYQQKQKDLRKEYGYSVQAGCVPALIQIPVFLGLYQVLLRMARPVEGLDANEHAPIGLLSSDDVSAFLNSRVSDVPLPAYNAMSAEQLARLNTTYDAVHAFVTPLIIAACVFTVINLIISVVRNNYAVDHDSGLAVQLNRFLIIMIFFTPLTLIGLGLRSPIPAAICMYWVANNLWTLIQNALMYLVLRIKYPFDEEHQAFQAHRRHQRRQRVQEKKARTRALRRKRLAAIIMPWHFSRYRAEIAEIKEERRKAKAEEKARKKALAQERKAARDEIDKERAEERKQAAEKKRAERAAARAKKSAEKSAEETT